MKHYRYILPLLFLNLSLTASSVCSAPNAGALISVQETTIQTEVETEMATEAETELITETETEPATEVIAEIESESEPVTETETVLAAAVPGIYELAAAKDDDFVLDVTYCTAEEKDSKSLQLYHPLDINQQKFYLELLGDDTWRISVLHTGDALTVSEDGTEIYLAPMERPEDTCFIESQTWTITPADEDSFYIQSSMGTYLTRDKLRLFLGAPVSLQEFTGKKNQRWVLNPTWISSADTADTDLIYPYGEDGPYENLTVTLDFGISKETITNEQLDAHTVLTENHTFVLDDAFLDSYLTEIASRYDTQGVPRQFKTSYGTIITLKKGDYGWKLDVEGTRNLILEHLDSALPITLEPVWAHKGFVPVSEDALNDIGGSYVEVDLNAQKVWLYENGKKILEDDCVSGTLNTDRQTPGGVYSIYHMQSPAVLNGPDYSSPVTYWMAFFGGYGLHDANWRSSFGGDIFKTNGSHGCVNLPTKTAETIYNTLCIGYPVVLYYY